METFIPILIAIVFFAFQVYNNFQKEQEKARKRNLAPPPLPEDNAQRLPSPTPATQPPVTNSRSAVTDPRPSITAPQPRFERYSGVVDAAEARRIRQGKRKRQTPERLEVDEGAVSTAMGNNISFDLRHAVIQSAILERPYQ
ncbi:hypothetical protein [Parapedobacter sp. DT-150]|uniref:hypothetical protein n=1 Tax=Parapedobacter sp. DT-150 TaxID=3396162 RepID=UPI003F19666E